MDILIARLHKQHINMKEYLAVHDNNKIIFGLLHSLKNSQMDSLRMLYYRLD
jgi:hypothetical protein